MLSPIKFLVQLSRTYCVYANINTKYLFSTSDILFFFFNEFLILFIFFLQNTLRHIRLYAKIGC